MLIKKTTQQKEIFKKQIDSKDWNKFEDALDNGFNLATQWGEVSLIKLATFLAIVDEQIKTVKEQTAKK